MPLGQLDFLRMMLGSVVSVHRDFPPNSAAFIGSGRHEKGASAPALAIAVEAQIPR
jgi:hypothetical protein